MKKKMVAEINLIIWWALKFKINWMSKLFTISIEKKNKFI